MKKLLSKSIIRQQLKNNWKLWAILTGVLCLFMVSITSVAPRMAKRAATQNPYGGEFNLLNTYSMMFFGGIATIIVLIYAIAVGNKLVASEVDRGTMSFTLNTPITRKQIILSKALFYALSLFVLVAMLGAVGTIANLSVGTGIDYGKFWLMIFGLFLFGFATSGICFFASCWFNKSGQSLMLGAGLPVAFFLLNSLSVIDELKFFKYLTLNSLFNTELIVSGGSFIAQFMVLALIGVALFVVGINKFLRKDLPL